MARQAILIGAWALRLLLAAFFLFVGYWKALGPYAALAEHRAWVADFPPWFARGLGWQEIVCALGLLVPAVAPVRGVAFWSAIGLLINQAVALGAHAMRGEAAQAAPQNLILIAALGAVAVATRGNRSKT